MLSHTLFLGNENVNFRHSSPPRNYVSLFAVEYPFLTSFDEKKRTAARGEEKGTQT
jgi:hypothetical protein